MSPERSFELRRDLAVERMSALRRVLPQHGASAGTTGGLSWVSVVVRSLIFAFSMVLMVGCANAAPSVAPTAIPTPMPTAALVSPPTGAPASTQAPRPPGAQGGSVTSADYKALVQPLLLPLGALIVAVRANTPTTTYWLGEFNKAADLVLPRIESDNSATANRLRTAIANIRATPNDLKVLEDNRSTLLAI
jgi:hypothetical protein